MTVSKMTVAQLREALAAKGLDATGLKAALVARLEEANGEGDAGEPKRTRHLARSSRFLENVHPDRADPGVVWDDATKNRRSAPTEERFFRLTSSARILGEPTRTRVRSRETRARDILPGPSPRHR
jgi:hypothetical protein